MQDVDQAQVVAAVDLPTRAMAEMAATAVALVLVVAAERQEQTASAILELAAMAHPATH
jgi:hypothetical protein